MPQDATNQMQALTTSLEECGPALSSIRLQLDDVWSGSNSALARCENRVNIVKNALVDITDRFRRLGATLIAREQHLEQRCDDIKADYQRSQRDIDQLTQSLSKATHRGDELQRRLEDTKDDLRYAKRRFTEGEQTVEDLKTQLRNANRRIEVLTDAAAAPPTSQPPPASPTLPIPGSTGGHGRPSTDSGFSEIPTAADPADRQRQNIAYGVLLAAISDFDAGNFAIADPKFADVQTMVRNLPSALRHNLDTTSIAYHRSVCRAETGTDREAETKLTEFLQSYDQAAASQKAHITHLLARTRVKLGRLDSALEHSCSAVGQWYEIDSSCDQYFDAVALLARIFVSPTSLTPRVRHWKANNSSICTVLTNQIRESTGRDHPMPRKQKGLREEQIRHPPRTGGHYGSRSYHHHTTCRPAPHDSRARLATPNEATSPSLYSSAALNGRKHGLWDLGHEYCEQACGAV